MSLFVMSSRIKDKKQYTNVLPSIVKGENSIQDTLVTDDGYAKSLVNFKYVDSMLQLGRGGLVKQLTTAIGADIVDICQSHSTLYVATASNVYSIAGNVATQKFTVTAAPQLINFNEELIVCDGGRTQLYNGTDLFYIGSHLDKITGETAASGQNIGSSTYNGSWTTPNDGRKRKVLMLTAWIKCVGSPISISITLNSKTSASVLYSEVGTEYQLVNFEFTDPPVLSPNATYTIAYTTVGGGSSDYFVLGKTATDDMIQLNGEHAPKAATGLVHNSVLWLCDDTDYPERAYISNINLADDFFTDNVAGYVSFCDSEDGVITGISMLFNEVALTGTDNGVPTTTLINNSYVISHKYIGGSSSRFAFLGSLTTLFFVHNEGMSVSQGSNVFGDLSFNIVSIPIQDRFDASNPANTIAAYMSSANQVWVKLDTETDVQVLNIANNAWTRYRFKSITPSCFRELNGEIYVGGTGGNLYKLDSDTLTDAGAAIDYEFITKSYRLAEFNQVRLKEFLIEVISGSSFSGTIKCSGANSSFDTTFSTTSAVSNIHYRVGVVGDYISFTVNKISTNSIPLIFRNIVVKYIVSGRKLS